MTFSTAVFVEKVLRNNPGKWMSTSEVAKQLPRRVGTRNAAGHYLYALTAKNGFESMQDNSTAHTLMLYRYNPEVAE